MSLCLVFPNYWYRLGLGDRWPSDGNRFLLREHKENSLYLTYDGHCNLVNHDRSRKAHGDLRSVVEYPLVASEAVSEGVRMFVACGMCS